MPYMPTQTAPFLTWARTSPTPAPLARASRSEPHATSHAYMESRPHTIFLSPPHGARSYLNTERLCLYSSHFPKHTHTRADTDCTVPDMGPFVTNTCTAGASVAVGTTCDLTCVQGATAATTVSVPLSVSLTHDEAYTTAPRVHTKRFARLEPIEMISKTC